MAPRIEPPEGAPAGPQAAGVAAIRGARVRLPSGEVVLSPRAQDVARMEEAVAAARQRADFVTVSFHFHWGQPDSIDPGGRQLVARAAVDAGADLILGHGPLVLEGIELYRGTPILYSIGNFVHHLPPAAYHLFPDVQRFLANLVADERFPESVLVRAIIGADGDLHRLELLPVEISEDGDPYFAERPLVSRILDRIESLSESLGTTISREHWYGVVNLLDAAGSEDRR